MSHQHLAYFRFFGDIFKDIDTKIFMYEKIFIMWLNSYFMKNDTKLDLHFINIKLFDIS
jgi:hypothetical protein